MAEQEFERREAEFKDKQRTGTGDDQPGMQGAARESGE